MSAASGARGSPVLWQPARCAGAPPELIAAERLLDDAVRRSQSAWGFVEPGVEERSVAHLRDDLATGAWDARYGALRGAAEFDGSLRLVVRPG